MPLVDGAASDGAAGGSTPLPEPVVVDITAPMQPDTVVLTPWATTRAAEQWVAVPAAGPAPTVVPDGPPVPEASPAPGGDAGPTGERPRTERRDHRRKSHRRVLVAIAIVSALLLATAGWAGAQRINHPLARPAVQSGVPATLPVPGASPSLPWPAKGQGAIAIPALSYAQQSGPEPPVPIASLTKMTNALVVLRDHPVPAGASGPSITITADDVAEYDTELHNDQSTVPIHTGEVLTELQMLEALLTQSANDMAYSLAMWDAGSIPAFVAKMNALAASLGTTATHYVDASGYDPGSVSTAADVLRVAAAGMADPTFASVVGMSSIDFPGVGTVPNVVSEIGHNGVIGVKSGYTSKAGGCLVLAANRVEGGHTVLVLAAVLGQPTPPPIVPKTTTTTAPKPAPTTTTTTRPRPPRPPAWSPRRPPHRPPPPPPPPLRLPLAPPPRPPSRSTTSRYPIRSSTPAR